MNKLFDPQFAVNINIKQVSGTAPLHNGTNTHTHTHV